MHVQLFYWLVWVLVAAVITGFVADASSALLGARDIMATLLGNDNATTEYEGEPEDDENKPPRCFHFMEDAAAKGENVLMTGRECERIVNYVHRLQSRLAVAEHSYEQVENELSSVLQHDRDKDHGDENVTDDVNGGMTIIDDVMFNHLRQKIQVFRYGSYAMVRMMNELLEERESGE